jgi:putative oxidoreductase
MNGQKDAAALVGRILLAAIFVTSGFSKLTDFGGTAGNIASEGVPLPDVATAISIVIELGGGLAILAGWMTRWVALAIVVFLIVITPIFHNYWSGEEAERMTNQIMFWKNVSILGGFLLLFAFGPGRYSVDKK